ncbi:hypothetical protein LWI29_009387 [Acer saccharum]|uniref:Uncharacterized protein n=1 Tax=Acer saccharum TaxID=4024 RepID=A0AA39SDC0_ACESA|nr:hypothetical protein LWI29_009387 [Acer saccharum]
MRMLGRRILRSQVKRQFKIEAKFKTDDDVIAIGDVFFANVEQEWVVQTGGPIAHKHGFLKFCNAKSQVAFTPSLKLRIASLGHHAEDDAQVEAMLDKTICAMSNVFIGASGSTFTEDILRLRKDWRLASVCDEYLCQGEEPNFIAGDDDESEIGCVPIERKELVLQQIRRPISISSGVVSQSSTIKQLWQRISSSDSSSLNAQLLIDFISDKMNNAWLGLEKAPDGSFKERFMGIFKDLVGLTLLARVKPSEIFLKSISREVTDVEVTYPSSLNPRLVRRRLRHIAMRGTIIHKKYFYGSVTLIPLTSALCVLPLPNVPFFWVLFRTYSHWRALQGSEKLLQLVSDHSQTQNLTVSNAKKSESDHNNKSMKVKICKVCHWCCTHQKNLINLFAMDTKTKDSVNVRFQISAGSSI